MKRIEMRIQTIFIFARFMIEQNERTHVSIQKDETND